MLFHHYLLCLFFMTTAGIAQNSLTIRGRVTDLAGHPAPDLRLMSAAKNDSVFTDSNSAFEIHIDKTVLGLGPSVPDDFMLSEPYPNPGVHDARIRIGDRSLQRKIAVASQRFFSGYACFHSGIAQILSRSRSVHQRSARPLCG